MKGISEQVSSLGKKNVDGDDRLLRDELNNCAQQTDDGSLLHFHFSSVRYALSLFFGTYLLTKLCSVENVGMGYIPIRICYMSSECMGCGCFVSITNDYADEKPL